MHISASYPSIITCYTVEKGTAVFKCRAARIRHRWTTLLTSVVYDFTSSGVQNSLTQGPSSISIIWKKNATENELEYARHVYGEKRKKEKKRKKISKMAFDLNLTRRWRVGLIRFNRILGIISNRTHWVVVPLPICTLTHVRYNDITVESKSNKKGYSVTQ